MHWLTDDEIESHNYIAYLFILKNSLAAQALSLPSYKFENWYSHLPMCPAGKPAGWREARVASHYKTISSSTARELPIYSAWKRVLHKLLTFKCFSNEFSDFNFSFYSTWCFRHIMNEIFHTLNHTESEINSLSMNQHNFRSYIVFWGGSS